jgi:acyl-CoA synthetase (AMP-forming)/AMP-acid ligase II
MGGDESGAVDIGGAQSIDAVIRDLGQRYPDGPAIVATGFGTCSFGELLTQTNQARNALKEMGLDRDARIVLSLPSQPEAALAVLAIAPWATVVPVDHKAPPAEVASLLAFVDADAVVVPLRGESYARRVAQEKGIPIIEARTGEGLLRLDLSMTAAPRTRLRTEPGAKDILYILQTSGTTSIPKHVLWSRSNQLAATSRLAKCLGLGRADRGLAILPVHHSYGMNTIWTAILTGGSVAFPLDPLRFDAAEWFDALEPTYYRAVPAQHLFIIENLRKLPPSELPRTLRMIVTGAAAISAEIRQSVQELLGAPLVETYGSTEAGFVSGSFPGAGPSKPGTVGVPEAGIVAVIGEDGRPVQPGEEGEVLIGGPTVVPGYLNAPDLNRAAFVDGWYRTGDIGFIDQEGFLTLRGRLKDIIARGAEKVAPLEVEEVLKAHPDVADIVVFGVPHDKLGEDVAAAIVARAGSNLTAAEVRKFAGGHLAWFKVPRRILFIDELPRGVTGKALRNVLRERAASALAAT